MKAVILAGGYGTRISEYTENIPKPMLTVGDKPLLWHVIQTYLKYGISDFVIALGYKAKNIKEYFLNFYALNSDLTINVSDGSVDFHKSYAMDFKVTLVDTGLETLTGGRLAKLKPFLLDQRFLLTYGDGVGNVNVKELIKCHSNSGKLLTMTAVRPAARFGELEFSDSGSVISFREKPQLEQGWINGGYFVAEPTIFNYLTPENSMLEREPLEQILKMNQLNAYKHRSFWHCVDTKRDLILMQKLWDENPIPPWLN